MFGGLHTPLWGKEIRIFAPVSPFQSPSEWTAATQPLKNNNNNNSHILEINDPFTKQRVKSFDLGGKEAGFPRTSNL